jgi:hypothetical protein
MLRLYGEVTGIESQLLGLLYDFGRFDSVIG